MVKESGRNFLICFDKLESYYVGVIWFEIWRLCVDLLSGNGEGFYVFIYFIVFIECFVYVTCYDLELKKEDSVFFLDLLI